MACTTILVGKKASNDNSTMIARNDDCPSGQFNVKKIIHMTKEKQFKKYKSINSKFSIELPNDPLEYTLTPNVDPSSGVWPAAGINSENVCMTATETITTNPRVLGADPYPTTIVNGKENYTGLGEEDLVCLILPYIHSAREGVIRLGNLLEKYGTYEPNGIAFSDKNEIWFVETIGGHNFIAKRVKDEQVVIMPNQLGIDNFDFEDAYTNQKENICSKGLKEFVIKNNLNLNKENLEESFNPRLAFGSHDDSDHIYNTPRAWIMLKYLLPSKKFEGEDPDFTPEADNLPWAIIPERKICIEDVKYLLSNYYQGTKYNPYETKGDLSYKNKYRPIGINRTSFLHILQIRNNVKKEIAALEWIAFASNPFNTLVPIYTNLNKVPTYLNNTTLDCNTNNFYWASRLISALADAHFNKTSILIERYQNKTLSKAHYLINKYDKILTDNFSKEEVDKANNELVQMIQKETTDTLNKVLYVASLAMTNSFSRSDN